MRNDIDKETYKWLFNIILFFGILLVAINGWLQLTQTDFSVKTVKFASSMLFLLVGVGIWIRAEYLKVYRRDMYVSRKFPMWASAIVAVFAAFWRLF
jgi:hypothetical protein